MHHEIADKTAQQEEGTPTSPGDEPRGAPLSIPGFALFFPRLLLGPWLQSASEHQGPENSSPGFMLFFIQAWMGSLESLFCSR